MSDFFVFLACKLDEIRLDVFAVGWACNVATKTSVFPSETLELAFVEFDDQVHDVVYDL